MKQELQVRITTDYGTRRVRAANALANKFLKLVGRKTFTELDIQYIKDLGYEITVEKETI